VDDEDREVCYVMRGGEGVKAGLCFVVEDFYPIMHGCTTQISMVGEQLVNVGMQVMVITRQLWQGQRCYEKLNGIEIIRVKPAVGVHRSGKYLMMVPAFLELIKQRKRYDVIIVCDLKALGIVGVSAGKALEKKCFLRAECCGEMDGAFATQFQAAPGRVKLWVIRSLMQFRNRVLFRADGFLSISSAIRREFVKAGVEDNAVTDITNGVHVERFKPASTELKACLKMKLGLCGEKYFVYTGRLTKGKGLEYLLRVWKRIICEFDEIRLILVGSAHGYSLSCEDELKAFVKDNNLESTVNFTGNVSNVEEYLQIADFFIFPSESEGLGLSLIEALGCGLPCIATSVGGIMDIIEDKVNGLLVPYGDNDKLFQAMKEVLTDPEKADRLGREGRKTVLKRFNIDHITEKYLSLFDNLEIRSCQ